MLGHEFAFTQTNQDHWIPLCSCGWVGTASTWRTIKRPRTKREVRNLDLTVDAIRGEWERHCEAEKVSISEASEDALARNAAYIAKVTPIVLRPGRFPTG